MQGSRQGKEQIFFSLQIQTLSFFLLSLPRCLCVFPLAAARWHLLSDFWGNEKERKIINLVQIWAFYIWATFLKSEPKEKWFHAFLGFLHASATKPQFACHWVFGFLSVSPIQCCTWWYLGLNSYSLKFFFRRSKSCLYKEKIELFL